jgi:hypothetical protein
LLPFPCCRFLAAVDYRERYRLAATAQVFGTFTSLLVHLANRPNVVGEAERHRV